MNFTKREIVILISALGDFVDEVCGDADEILTRTLTDDELASVASQYEESLTDKDDEEQVELVSADLQRLLEKLEARFKEAV